jgi:dCMP deaminase
MKSKKKSKKPIKKSASTRPSWDEYFTEIMKAVSTRSTCDRGHSACVFVKDKQILVTGYAGSPVGFPHCDEVGHDLRKSFNEDGMVSEHCVRTVHAEQNALCQAAKKGVSLDGATVYVNMTPCRVCTMLLINCGVKRIYAEKKYHTGSESEKMFKKAKIKLDYKFNELQKYPDQKG